MSVFNLSSAEVRAELSKNLSLFHLSSQNRFIPSSAPFLSFDLVSIPACLTGIKRRAYSARVYKLS